MPKSTPIQQYAKTQRRIKVLQGNWLGRLFWLKSARKKAKLRKAKCFDYVDQVLQSESSEYNSLVRRNLELLSTGKAKFTAYAYSNDSFSKAFAGRLSSNGNFYVASTRTGWFEYTLGFEYPSGFSGDIDHFGRIRIKAISYGASFRSLVKTYIGSIDAEGKILLRSQKREGEAFLLTGGKINIHKMIAKQFPKGSPELKEFFANSNKMKLLAKDKFEALLDEALD